MSVIEDEKQVLSPQRGGRLVWVSGCSGAGKSFTGDYLEAYAGFTHLDGDEIMRSTASNDVELKKGLVKAFYEYWFAEKEAPVELWHPYYQHIAKRIDNANKYDDENKATAIVVTLSVYNRECRDYIRRKWPHVVFIQLECNTEELVKRHIVRFKEYADAQGQSIEACFENVYKKPYSYDNYRQVTLDILRGLQPIVHSDEPNCFTLDVSVHNHALFETLHRFLGLDPPRKEGDIRIQEIARKNYERFKQ